MLSQMRKAARKGRKRRGRKRELGRNFSQTQALRFALVPGPTLF